MKEIYFDNAATTAVSEDAAFLALKVMTGAYGNPSSLHAKGVEAESYVREAGEKIAATLKADRKEIYFTSGGTEANNTAVFGAAYAGRRKGNTILTTSMEHPSVSEPLKKLKGEGFNVVECPVDSCGRLDMDFVENALGGDVILVTMMAVNNEIGAVTPVDEIGRLVKAKAPQALYHVDAIQAYAKYRIRPHEAGIDLMSVSGHKLGAPKGTGFLYKADGVRIEPRLYGGGQMNGLRSGTENVPGIAALGIAANETYEDLEENVKKLRSLREYARELFTKIPDTVIHGMPDGEGAPHILHAAFLGVGSEVLLHELESEGIYVSAGSACSSHKRNASPTMAAIGAPAEEVASSVRFSFGPGNTEEEVEYAAEALEEIIPRLRRYRRH